MRHCTGVVRTFMQRIKFDRQLKTKTMINISFSSRAKRQEDIIKDIPNPICGLIITTKFNTEEFFKKNNILITLYRIEDKPEYKIKIEEGFLNIKNFPFEQVQKGLSNEMIVKSITIVIEPKIKPEDNREETENKFEVDIDLQYIIYK